MPTEAKELMLGVRGDSKTIAGWVNGHVQLKSKESTTANVQNLLGAVRWIHDNVWPIGQFTPSTNTTMKPIPWPGQASKDVKKEWADIGMVWSEVARLCGVWDRSCENGTCFRLSLKPLVGSLFTKILAGCGVGILWMPNWAAAVC